MPAAEGGRIGYADAGNVRKDPDEVVAGMDNELNPGILRRMFGPITGPTPGADEGANLIEEIQDYKYGESYPGEEIWGGKDEHGRVIGNIPKPDRPPMSMEDTIAALEAKWDQAVEDLPEGIHYAPPEFEDMGIYRKEDIRRRVELGYDQAKGPETKTGIMTAADGGRIGYQGGYMVDDDEEEDHRVAALRALYGRRRNAQEGGLMDMGGMEKDYRQEGGFVPIGGQERADDVPARLSKNEFVFTADAVRAAGGGDIDAGAEIMENVMENLEQGGEISQQSQGLEGARDMFATAQRLEGVL